MSSDQPESSPSAGFDRRRFLTLASALGAAVVPGLLLGEEKGSGIDAKTLADAEKLTGSNSPTPSGP